MKAIFLIMMLVVYVFAEPSENTKRVKGIFERNCTSCHGKGGQIFDVMNPKDMADKNLVQGENNSRLYQALNRTQNWMPLGKPPLSIDEKQAIFAWLKEGYPSFEEEVKPPPTTGGILTYGNEVRCIAQDVVSYAKKYSKDDARYFRYLTLSTYHNENDRVELDRTHEAIDKFLNSISLSANIYFTTPIPCNGVPGAILRINLKDFNLEPDDWDNLLINGKYPYAVAFFENFEFALYEKEIAFFTQAQTIAYIRGDWFIGHASQAPLYYDLLFKKFKVNTIQDLEKFLRVDTFRQLFKDYEARRAIIHRSGVTNFNRIIDRYELEYFRKGAKQNAAYWKTFDVNTDKAADQKNLFAFPFGPLFTFYKQFFPNFLLDKVFKFDASEIIWENENGTLGFFVADGNENRLNEAALAIAVDRTNNPPFIGVQGPGTVVVGTSCFNCHSGMNSFVDDARNHIAKSSDFDNLELDYANLLLWKNKQESDYAIAQSNDRYAKGAVALKAKKVVYAAAEEPIFASTKDYFYDINVCKFGAELGYACDEIKEKLYHAPGTARLLGLSETLVGRASRANVERLFAQIVQDLNIGIQVVFEAKKVTPPSPPPKVEEPPPPPKKACKTFFKNDTQLYQLVEKAEFANTSYGPFYLSPGEKRAFDHDVGSTTSVCSFYNSSYCIRSLRMTLEACTQYSFYRWSDGYTYFGKSSEQP